LSRIKAINTLAIDSAARRDQKELIEKINLDITSLKKLNNDLKENDLPLGWKQEDLSEMNSWIILKKIGGLLLSVFAVALGSPFWFDIMSKLANLRSSGNKPKTLLESSSEK